MISEIKISFQKFSLKWYFSLSGVIAAFKCLGAPGSLITTIYLMQILMIAAIGSAIGAGLSGGSDEATLIARGQRLAWLRDAAVLAGENTGALRDFRSRANAAPSFQRNLERFTQFLTLVGLAALLVGGSASPMR